MKRVAGIVLDNRDGGILAESAWASGRAMDFSPAVAGRVQPGSTYKPFAMLAALEQGFPSDLMLQSSPFESGMYSSRPGTPWRVRNYARQYRGPTSLKEALILSDNTAFARLIELLDIRQVGALYTRFGLASAQHITPSIVLGAIPGGISLVQLAAAFSALARNGVYLPAHGVRGVAFADGTIWRRGHAPGLLAVPHAGHVRAVHDALLLASRDLSAFGVAGKSGTTATGTLFAGYSRELSMVLWGEYRTSPAESDPKHLSALQIAARFARRAFAPGRAFSI